MIRNFFLGLAFVLLSLNSVAAQEQSFIVRTDDATAFKANAARLSNVITRNNGKFEDKFQLSFQVSNVLQSALPKTRVVLTAYKADGSIFGQHIWCSASKGIVSDFSANELQIALNANPKLQGASSYSLSMLTNDITPEEATLQECVNAATSVCGRGQVASVNSTADGNCSFTCKN